MTMWGFPAIEGPLLGFPIMRTRLEVKHVAFYIRTPIYGNSRICRKAVSTHKQVGANQEAGG